VQRLAFKQATAYPGDNGTRARRLGLLDDHVQALFDSQAGAYQGGKLAGEQGEVATRQAPAQGRTALFLVAEARVWMASTRSGVRPLSRSAARTWRSASPSITPLTVRPLHPVPDIRIQPY